MIRRATGISSAKVQAPPERTTAIPRQFLAVNAGISITGAKRLNQHRRPESTSIEKLHLTPVSKGYNGDVNAHAWGLGLLWFELIPKSYPLTMLERAVSAGFL